MGVLGMLRCHALWGARARGGAAPCAAGRAGRGRAGLLGREKRSRHPRGAVVRVLCFPSGTSSRRAGPESSASLSLRS